MKTIYNKLLLLMLLLPISVLAQSSFTGVVKEKPSGIPMPGVSVTVEGTSNGTSTDFNGNFNLTNIKKGDKIVFSFIGFVQEIITFTDQKNISILLAEDASELEEVVVVGYGSVRKKDITGAVSKVTAENLNQGTLVDPIQALQGKAAGVTITKQGGDPNAGFNVRIRGAAGFAAGGGPLYVVDGVRGVDITTIAPEDIVSFDVLKDAASTAIYGADGANGVIFVTTKRGKEGKTVIEYNTYVAMDQVARKLDLLSASEYRSAISAKGISFVDNGGNIDWQDEIYRGGTTLNHNFAISGGNEKSNYRASLTHTDFEGVIKGSNKERTTGKIDLTQKSFDDKLVIKMGLSSTIERNKYINYGGNGVTDALFQSFQRLPTDPIYNADGTFFETSMFNYFNPVAILDQIQNQRDAKRLNGYTNFDLELASGLNANVNLTYLRNDSESTYFEPTYSNILSGNKTEIRRGHGKRSYENWEQGMLEATLTYKKTFGESHNLTALAGYSYRTTNWDGFAAQGRNPISNFLGSDNMQNFEDVLLGDITSYKNERKDIGMFARVMYDFASKYYVTGMVRRDGSSVFGENNQWGYFPSVQVAWNIANEKFISDNFSQLNMLKLRGSYGISGNSNVDPYRNIYRIGILGTTIDPNTALPIINLGYMSEINKDFKWDSNRELNLGLDFGFFNNRITGSIEYYQKDLTNLLSAYNAPTDGRFIAPVIYLNGGEIQNKGFEATLNAEIIRSNDFSWNSTITYSTNTQKIISLDTSGKFPVDQGLPVNFVQGPGLVGVSTQWMKEGYKLGTFYGYEYAGVSDGRWLIKGNDGEIHFMDEQGNSREHKKVIGNALPDFEMGWSNYFKYKNWDLSMSFRAVVGHEIYNATNMVFGNPDHLGTRNVNNEAVILNGHIQGAYYPIDYYIEDGSFIKLDNVNIGYNFINPSFAKAINKIRVYASVNNVFTLTNYGGIDPEINFSGGNGSNEIYFGNDQYNIYPKTRTVTFGLNITF